MIKSVGILHKLESHCYYERDCGKLRESILVVRAECRRGI